MQTTPVLEFVDSYEALHPVSGVERVAVHIAHLLSGVNLDPTPRRRSYVGSGRPSIPRTLRWVLRSMEVYLRGRLIVALSRFSFFLLVFAIVVVVERHPDLL